MESYFALSLGPYKEGDECVYLRMYLQLLREEILAKGELPHRRALSGRFLVCDYQALEAVGWEWVNPLSLLSLDI